MRGTPQLQVQHLFCKKPEEEWEWKEWIEAVTGALGQVGPHYEARQNLFTSHLKSEQEFPNFVSELQGDLAIINSDLDNPMSDLDQVFFFRRAIKDTGCKDCSEIRPIRNEPYKVLSDITEERRVVYQNRFIALSANI